MHTAASIGERTGDCALALTWPLSTAALAIGWASDNAQRVGQRCGLAPATTERP